MAQRMNIRREDIVRALRIYWRHAWPEGAGVCPVLPDWGDLSLPEVLARFADESARTPHACHRYVLRLGNHAYPHMKFAIEQCVYRGDYYFLADCHDDAAAPRASDSGEWQSLRNVNYQIKLAIEAEWERADLPTFRTLSHEATSSFSRAGQSNGRILIVDDEPANAELTGAMLRADGFGTETVASGADALARVNEHKPDLVVSDYEMPGMNGRDVAQHLKADKDTAQIPVLICTYAEVTVSDLKPADALLRRPFSRQDLSAAVGKLLKRRAS
ncbi:MAG: response regulator [Planctomycetes bacterium]|nr:response regulator [Planctomycetota bacterium]MCW8136252.1 response regulator [Planctomycetota bacterium]